MLFRSKGLTPELDRQFLESIKSFRSLRTEERDALQPLHLSLVTVSEGDTVEKVIAQMRGVDRPLDQFLIVNGLDRPKLKMGTSYKLITAD